jgi:hypothetical protein
VADAAEAKRVADAAEAKRVADAAEAKRVADAAEAKRVAQEEVAEETRLAEEVAEETRLAEEAAAKGVADAAAAKGVADAAAAKGVADAAAAKARLEAETETNFTQLWDSLRGTPYAMESMTNQYMEPREDSLTTRKSMPNWESCLYDCFKDPNNQTFSYNYTTLDCMCTEQPDEGYNEKDDWERNKNNYNGFDNSTTSIDERFMNGWRVKKKWSKIGAIDCYNRHPRDRIGHGNCGNASGKGPKQTDDSTTLERYKLHENYEFFNHDQ